MSSPIPSRPTFPPIYEAGGPAVHLVKRFESAAQAGQILVSESCQSLSAGLVTFNALPPRRMEGFPAPVPCYELVEISGSDALAGSFDQGAIVLCGTRGGDRAAGAGCAGGRLIRTDRGAGGHGGDRQIPRGTRIRRCVAAARTGRCSKPKCNPLEQTVPYSLLKKLLQSASSVAESSSQLNKLLRLKRASAHADLWPAALCSVLDQPVGNPRWNDLNRCCAGV